MCRAHDHSGLRAVTGLCWLVSVIKNAVNLTRLSFTPNSPVAERFYVIAMVSYAGRDCHPNSSTVEIGL